MATIPVDMLVERMRTIHDFNIGKIIDILDAYDKEKMQPKDCPLCIAQNAVLSTSKL